MSLPLFEVRPPAGEGACDLEGTPSRLLSLEDKQQSATTTTTTTTLFPLLSAYIALSSQRGQDLADLLPLQPHSLNSLLAPHLSSALLHGFDDCITLHPAHQTTAAPARWPHQQPVPPRPWPLAANADRRPIERSRRSTLASMIANGGVIVCRGSPQRGGVMASAWWSWRRAANCRRVNLACSAG